MHTLAHWRENAALLKPETRHFIDGAYVPASDERTFSSINPATGRPVAEIARGTARDIDTAVAAARRSFRKGVWSRMAPRARMRIMQAFADLIEANGEKLALLDTLEMGKPISSSLGVDLPASVNAIRFFAETIDKIEGVVTNTDVSALHYILRQPLGVVGLIVPWNYPLMMACWKLGPALATGNSIVLKPAEQSSLSALMLGELFVQAGGPPGVLNVVTGLGEEVGKALALHMDVDKIGFTGSTEIGKLLLIYAGQSNMKRVTTECGGKSPQIILSDYDDLDTAAAYAVDGIYSNQGEVCSAGSRILVDRKIHDAFVERFIATAGKRYAVGDPLDPSTTMGPLVDKRQQERVLGYVDGAVKEGAKLELGGRRSETFAEGAYVEPTLFSKVMPGMQIAREEVFGPVAAIMPVDGADHALSIANDSIYGLAASIWTKDLATAHRFARDVEAGVVWVNCYEHGDMTSIWGGFKQTGNGRDKCLEALTQFSQTKSVWLNLG
ncbi:aldehyde dehydrogenase [Rhizobium sp. RAF56]|uniref:aldehyde dehydrogenase n=1 Tax=Rhizobium sp. RAF56 TaxID=3233062 RepID=UPI003F97ABE7